MMSRFVQRRNMQFFTYINLLFPILFLVCARSVFKQFVACYSVIQYFWYNTVYGVLLYSMFCIYSNLWEKNIYLFSHFKNVQFLK